MSLTLDYLQVVTVYAFLEALAQQNEPLPPDLQQAINQVGDTLAINPKAAVNSLLILAKHDRLQLFYEQARMNIQKQYNPQECNKYDLPNNQNQPEPTPPETLANFAVVILKDPKPEKKSKEHQSEIMVIATQYF